MSDVWDIKYTATDGVRCWFDQILTESDAHIIVREMKQDSELFEEFRDPVAVNRTQDLRERFPIGARVDWAGNKCTVRDGYEIILHSHRPNEVITVALDDDSRVLTVIADFVTLAD
ncbi:hypothetical protein [Nocardia abscessus]|uniref:hypothetical protein n=1 Tax=Nocardia abscessus TaxID=120957 RepID=UPI0024540BF7|nr:hypothetical protein [Nocardia abscessus]